MHYLCTASETGQSTNHLKIKRKNKQRKRKNNFGIETHYHYHEPFNVLPGKQATVLIRDKLSHQPCPAAAATGAICQGTQEMIYHDDIVGRLRRKKESGLGRGTKSRELC